MNSSVAAGYNNIGQIDLVPGQFELDTPAINTHGANKNQTPGWLLGYEPSKSSPTSN
jgi:hypothetical protein